MHVCILKASADCARAFSPQCIHPWCSIHFSPCLGWHTWDLMAPKLSMVVRLLHWSIEHWTWIAVEMMMMQTTILEILISCCKTDQCCVLWTAQHLCRSCHPCSSPHYVEPNNCNSNFKHPAQNLHGAIAVESTVDTPLYALQVNSSLHSRLQTCNLNLRLKLSLSKPQLPLNCNRATHP